MHINHHFAPQRDREYYFDAQATEQVRPEAIAALNIAFREFGNAGATNHGLGRRTRQALEDARGRIASLVNAPPEAVFFTSGATEANNIVLQSLAAPGQRRAIASAIEHKSVIEPLAHAAGRGAEVVFCPVDQDGLVDPESLRNRVTGGSIVSVMQANNEIGTIQPVAAIRDAAPDALFHVDAAQSFCKVPIDFDRLGLDFLTLSAHKIGGPQGIGALVVRPSRIADLQPLFRGGAQEAGLRPGTTPVGLVVAMSAAAEAAMAERDQQAARLGALRDKMVAAFSRLPGFFVNGSLEQRLSGNLNCGFDGIDALLLMRRVPHLLFSAGSACTTGNSTNHVLDALGLPNARQRATFRLSLGWATSDADVDAAITGIEGAVGHFASSRQRAV